MALQDVPIREDAGGAILLEDGSGESLLYATGVAVVFPPVFKEVAYPDVFRE